MQMALQCVVLAAGLGLTGCEIEGFENSQRHKEDFKHAYDMKPEGSLELDNLNGSVEIYAWDQEKIEISGTKYASDLEKLKALRVEITSSGNRVVVRSLRPSGERWGSIGVRYTIYLPRRTKLDRIQSSNGGIRVEGVEGAMRLRTSNGRVRVLNAKGEAEVTTSNGGIEMSSFSGSAILRTSNGGITVDGVRGRLEADTSNGGIDARVAELDASRGLKLDTSNGGITVRLPAAINAELRASTSNASITSEFDVKVRGAQSKTHLEGSIGSGGPLIDLDTSNGSIRILRL